MDCGSDNKASSNEEPECVETDPSGRYRRYQKVLGKGALKTVYWAFDELEGMEVAWSQVKIRDVFRHSGILDRLNSEIYFLKTLDHKNIIKFYHYWIDSENNTINIITELFTSGTLRQYRQRHGHVNLRAIKNWSRQILEGLLYLHTRDPPIIHRDLKCDNIFVNGSQGLVKIGDLGLASIFRPSHSRPQSVIGTPEFMAPELYDEQYNELVDIYSFGMCLLEMITFEYPYSECQNVAQIYKKVSLGVKPAALEKVEDPILKEFVEKCLETANRRLTARELLMDSFLQEDGPNPIYPRKELTVTIPKYSFLPPRIPSRLRDKQSSVQEGILSSRSFGKRNHASILQKINNSRNMEDFESSFHQIGITENIESQEGSRRDAAASSAVSEQDSMSRDFKVKGKVRDNQTVNLRLRIADSQGYTCSIHFPFNVEADTAIIVASEMVAELDLSEQDVTRIAERIDEELVELVPGWKPGASFEDSPKNSSHGRRSSSSDMLSDDELQSKKYVIQRLPSGREYWSEVPVQPNPWSRKASMKNNSFMSVQEQEENENENEVDESPKKPASVSAGDALANDQEYGDHSHPELVKSMVVAEVKNHISTEGDGHERTLSHSTVAKDTNTADGFEFPSSRKISEDFTEQDRSIEKHLKRLAVQHQQELEALRWKHEQALQDLKNILRQRSFTFNSRDAPRISYESRQSFRSDTELLSFEENNVGKGMENSSEYSLWKYRNGISYGNGDSGEQTTVPRTNTISLSRIGVSDLSPEVTSFRSVEQLSPEMWSCPRGYISDPSVDLAGMSSNLTNDKYTEHERNLYKSSKLRSSRAKRSAGKGKELLASVRSAFDTSSLGDYFRKDRGSEEPLKLALKDENSPSTSFQDRCLPAFRSADKPSKLASIFLKSDFSIRGFHSGSKRRSREPSREKQRPETLEKQPLQNTSNIMAAQKTSRKSGSFFRSRKSGSKV